MAYDAEMAAVMRDDLGPLDGLAEKAMFGGICFLLHGNMVCGISKDGAMYRVGKGAEPRALSMPGAGPIQFTGRKMGGFIEVDMDGFENDENRRIWTELSIKNAKTYPAK